MTLSWGSGLTFALLIPALAADPDWKQVEAETLKHFQALVRLNTSDPPGNELPAVEYLKKVLEAEGIEVRTFAKETRRPNLVARLKGTGAGKPILLMAHTDTVNVDPAKWADHGPFSADRADGRIYGRGTIDDKDNVAATLMTMLLLKRSGVPLSRDVIFLAEAGEEGRTEVGIQFMVEQHWQEIDAEYCLAEGGGGVRRGGKPHRYVMGTGEKTPYRIDLIAHGTAGHGSVPLPDNAIGRLSGAIAKVIAYTPPMMLNDSTRSYFERLATISTPEQAARYNGLMNPEKSAAVQEYLRKNEPRHWSMLRTSISPTMLTGGIRKNVIPSEARAVLDVRVTPGDKIENVVAALRQEINDPNVEVVHNKTDAVRPLAEPARLDTGLFRALLDATKRVYDIPLLPSINTGGTDKVFLQQRGMQCYGIGPLLDEEDGALGYGAHSDRERIVEEELHKFVRFNWEVVRSMTGTQ